ncbi:MAG: HD-GYP domain-containing protein [Spirochaetota bacterium]
MAKNNDISIDLTRFHEISVSYLDKLSGDKVLTFDVFDQDGKTVFSSGRTISGDDIKKCSASGKRFFIPRTSESTGSFTNEIVGKKKMNDLVEDTASVFDEIRRTGKMNYEQYLRSNAQLTSVVDGLRPEDKMGGVLSLLRDINDFDHYTYTHSVNVGILAMIMAYKEMGSGDAVKTYAMAGYLHDIGKLRIDQAIIQKPGLLSPEEYYRVMEHTREGYRILDSVQNSGGEKVVPNTIKLTALFHHRKFQSPGYPFRTIPKDKSREAAYNELPEISRLIGICDMYEAISSTAPYRTPQEPVKALRYILNLSNYLYSINDTYRFLKSVSLSLNKGQPFLTVGDFVMIESVKIALDTKKKQRIYEIARIEDITRSNFLVPKVQIFYDVVRRNKIKPINVDLRYDTSRKIVRVFESDRIKEMMRQQLM